MMAGLRLPIVLVFFLVHGFAAAASPCIVRSGERTAALVELYTSQDCSSCGPADRWLSELGRRYEADRVVPLALHVDYRDYLGSKDRRAQRRLTVLQRMALVYTPQVILQGRDFGAWHSSAFDDAVTRINARPARARLQVQIRGIAASGLDAVAEGELLESKQAADAAVYMAAVQSRRQDHVVLEWQGPLAARPDGRFSLQRRLALLPGATPATSGVAAFVQDRRTGEMLQAVLLAACSP